MGLQRKVFYVGGFDPRGVRFYYQLMKEQVARYAAKTGEDATVSRRRTVSPIRSDWRVENATLGAATDYSFLRWEDIVQRAWIKSPLALARRAVRTYRAHWRHLDMKRIAALDKGTLITLFYPPVFTLLLPLLIALPLFLVALVWLPWWAALLIGLAVGVVTARPILAKLHAPWLMRFFVFNSELGSDGNPALDERLATFAGEIAGGLAEGHDEVLLVTHSNGSILAVPLMLDLLARFGGTMPDRFRLVTYGHCIPLIGCRADAPRFREQLLALGKGAFRWLDIGSPPDGAAFFGTNPLLLHAAAATPEVTLLSPRFHIFYDPASYHKGWGNKYEIHFDYLRVGDRVSPLDHPSMVAGGRRIDEAVAAFRAIA